MIKDTLKKISPAAPINFLFYQQAKIVKKQKKKKKEKTEVEQTNLIKLCVIKSFV